MSDINVDRTCPACGHDWRGEPTCPVCDYVDPESDYATDDGDTQARRDRVFMVEGD